MRTSRFSKDALDKVMNLNNWHGFINIVAEGRIYQR